jgi:hypothetical protein
VNICRLRDAARLFHSRGLTSLHWSGIRVDRLSSHHGEFCKLFCSQTGRQVDFFSDDGEKSSGEQLLNMIGNCTAFSIGNQLLPIDVEQGSPPKPFNCTVHSSPPVVLSVVASSSNPSDPSAPKPATAQPTKLWTGCMNGAGVWSRDERRLVADTMVSFSDAGCGLPLSIHAGCRYQPTCIEDGSFQLLRPNFCSLFDVDRSDLNDVKLALEKVRKSAVGQPISKHLRDLVNADPADHSALKLALEGVQAAKHKPVDLKTLLSVDHENHAALKSALEEWKKTLVSHTREPGVIDFRNMLAFNNMLTLEARHFEALVACARTMLAGVCIAHRFVCPNVEDSNCAEQSLAEIDRIVERDLSLQGLDSTMTDHQRDGERLLDELEERMRLLEECDRLEEKKFVRKFDSFAPCLTKDIEDQLVESNRIGSGGQGSVYRVKHKLWGQPLAVKVFHCTGEGYAWLRELNSHAVLPHPNIVRMMYNVYETLADRSDCRAPAGYAMELMELSAADPREFTLAQLLSVFVQIASALAFCHAQGVIHFNVKPATILLDESCSVAKLSNFGCSHMLDSAFGRQNEVRGTLLYMAPEQFHADFESDPKLCDIYSLGKTMWKLLHPSLSAVPFTECQVIAHVPPALKELVEQCTMRDPAERPRDMCEVLGRLQIISQEYHDASISASAASSAAALQAI